MHILKFMVFTILIGTLLVSTGCGSGSSGSGSGTNTLKLTFSVGATPYGKTIGGIQGTITFPVGTTVSLDPEKNDGSLLPGMFVLTGTASTSTSDSLFGSQTFTFGILNANGFTGGDFATLTVDVISGSPAPADFTISNITVIDTTSETLDTSITIK